ncbi:hypothetical protein L248_0561 [Schleiferilactobacillus shenzhenensis LY-73]|uniref:Integral membrane protein n=1 Tax=Schleiferilactobacillus shenzhenensis LY-73 TaxID=1231336 RepID=U4TKR4_9LACO|nr:hypothetical protein L248_0561 [Schleiferilactobacillus shenzhenensis LY-73]
MHREFKTFYWDSFWEINGIGWIGLALIGLLLLDLSVNRTFIHSLVVQYILVVLLILALSYLMYLFTIYARYQLRFWQYFRQAFIISVARFSNTLATILATFLVGVLITSIPVLAFLVLVPLYLTPIVWFTYQSCIHIEAVIHNGVV